MIKPLQLIGLPFIIIAINVPFTKIVSAGEIIQKQGCDAIGRVLVSHDSGISNNSMLCEGAQVRVGIGLKIQVICYKQAKVTTQAEVGVSQIFQRIKQ